MIPRAKAGGWPRSTDDRAVDNAILYLVRTGGPWRQLSNDFPPWQTLYRYFRRLQESGAVRKIQRELYDAARVSELRKRY